DVQQLRAFVRSGGTLVAATEQGIFDRGIFNAFGVRVSGIATAGAHDVTSAAFADPPARSIFIDRGVTLVPGPQGEALATDGRAAIIAAVRDGSGIFIAVGSLWPFLGGGLGEADNARVVLALLRPALGRPLAFDAYHHRLHPPGDLPRPIEKTWPGRAPVFA